MKYKIISLLILLSGNLVYAFERTLRFQLEPIAPRAIRRSQNAENLRQNNQDQQEDLELQSAEQFLKPINEKIQQAAALDINKRIEKLLELVNNLNSYYEQLKANNVRSKSALTIIKNKISIIYGDLIALHKQTTANNLKYRIEKLFKTK